MNTYLTNLIPNPQQPRQTFDSDQLFELAQSIRSAGLIQPVVVEAAPDNKYIINDGERRWRASMAVAVAEHRLAGAPDDDDSTLKYFISQVANGNMTHFLNANEPLLKETEIKIAVTKYDGDERARAVRAIVANVQRADLNDVELGKAYQKLADAGLTDQQIADAVGKSRSTVANLRRLCKLPDYVQAAIAAGTLSARTAQAALPALDIKPHEMEHAYPKLKSDPNFQPHYDVPTPTALFKRLASPNCSLTSELVREIIDRIKKAITPKLCPKCQKVNLKTIPDNEKNYLRPFNQETGEISYSQNEYCRDCYLDFMGEYALLSYQGYCRCGALMPVTGVNLVDGKMMQCPQCKEKWFPWHLRTEKPKLPEIATEVAVGAPIGADAQKYLNGFRRRNDLSHRWSKLVNNAQDHQLDALDARLIKIEEEFAVALDLTKGDRDQ